MIQPVESASPTTPVARFEQLTKESLSERAYEEVRRFLMRGKLRPRQRLVTRTLAAELGVSTTPLREALLRLASENALDIDSRGTVVVPALTRESYIEIRDLRAYLEGQAAERAVPQASAEDIGRLEGVHRDHVAAESRGDFAVALEYNEEFHFGLCRLARLPIQFRIIEMLWAQCGPLLNHFYGQHASVWAAEAHPHLAVIEALRRHDGAAARQAIEADILTGAEPILAELRNDYGR